MFVNLSAVMLRLCEPFLDNMESKKDKIDVNYLFCNRRVDFKWVSLHQVTTNIWCSLLRTMHNVHYFANQYIVTVGIW
jgi:ubiquitin conjugation factor E4 B